MKAAKEVVTGLTFTATIVFSGVMAAEMIIDFTAYDWVLPALLGVITGAGFIVELELLYPDEEELDYHEEESPPLEERNNKLEQEGRMIALDDTHCPACGAPLDSPDRCSYCRSRIVLYKKA